MLIRAANVDNFSSVAKEKMSKSYTGKKDLGLDKQMAMMCDAFYGFIRDNNKVPTMDGYYDYYLKINNGKELDNGQVGWYGNRGWAECDTQALFDRLYLSWTGAMREVQLMTGLNRRGIDAWYDNAADKAGIDIMCDIDGVRVGVACYTYTADGCRWKKSKNHYHTYNIPMVDAPCVLGGHSTITMSNKLILYTTPYMDGIAAQVRSTAKMVAPESA